MTTPASIVALAHVRAFLLAGHAKFTLVSKVTGARKTFEVKYAKPTEKFPEGWMVSLLVGPDNGSDYRYIGIIRKLDTKIPTNVMTFVRNRQQFAPEACAAVEWFLRLVNVDKNDVFNAQAEFWHSGFCARCGRELTDPESIASGLGPVCREKGGF